MKNEDLTAGRELDALVADQIADQIVQAIYAVDCVGARCFDWRKWADNWLSGSNRQASAASDIEAVAQKTESWHAHAAAKAAWGYAWFMVWSKLNVDENALTMAQFAQEWAEKAIVQSKSMVASGGAVMELEVQR